MKQKIYLSALGLLLSTTALAQTKWSVGPQFGLTYSTASFKKYGTPFTTTYRVGFEAGIQAAVAFGHFALQPALLYSQLGFGIDNTRSFDPRVNAFTYHVDEHYRFQYLTFIPQFVYRLHVDGSGLQAFVSPYGAFLLGGNYSANDTNEWASGAGLVQVSDGQIKRGSHNSGSGYVTTYYMPSFDAGLQAGVGYRLGPALLQASYSLGLLNLGSDYSSSLARTDYYNRAFRLSASYQFAR